MPLRKLMFPTLVTFVALGGGCTAAPPTAMASDSSAGESPSAVYFLGVDQLPAGDEGAHLAALFSSTPADRWALTDAARAIAARAGSGAVDLSAPIDRWNPKTDPYNFGLVSLRGASYHTLTWEGKASRTLVRIDLTWLQIGHEQRTRMQSQKLPELRYSVSLYEISEFNSDLPPTQEQLDGFYRKAFDASVTELLRRANRESRRLSTRTAGQLRYVLVTPPVVLDSAGRSVSQFSDVSASRNVAQGLSDAMASYLEHKLLESFSGNAGLDDVVLLPNAQTLAYLQGEWSSFARRVAALSTYSANLEATGFQPPRLLHAVPVCTATDENNVHALEVRSNLADIKLRTTPYNKRVEWVTLTAFLAADVKLPLDGTRSRQPLAAPMPPLQTNATSTAVQKPVEISAEDFLGFETAQRAIATAVEPLASAVAARLLDILRNSPPLSHPSYQGSCREQ
ncbi:MAG: hypothetical protein WDO68_31170 [Gammaproteobacteria bacterium]